MISFLQHLFARFLFPLLYTLIIHLAYFLGLFFLPLIMHFKGKYRKSWREKFFSYGFIYPDKTAPPTTTVWFHAVSLGESKALMPLLKHWRSLYPSHIIIATASTETGYVTLKKECDALNVLVNYLPFDLPLLTIPLVRRVKPDYLILIEGDFWYYHLKAAKKISTKIYLVNGKISLKTHHRYQRLAKWGASQFYEDVDLFLLQNQLYADRWLSLGIPKDKVHVTGNLKFSRPPTSLPLGAAEAHRQHWGYPPEATILIFASTHKTEETLLLDLYHRLRQRVGNLYCILVPRHPERSQEVQALIKDKGIPYRTYSDWKNDLAPAVEPIFLIDAIGVLATCYAVGTLAIVGGSFIPLGGHNILEPAEFKTPVFYGPHMHAQEELRQLMLAHQAGGEVSLENIEEIIYYYLTHHQERIELGQRGYNALQEQRGALQKTWQILPIESHLSQNISS